MSIFLTAGVWVLLVGIGYQWAGAGYERYRLAATARTAPRPPRARRYWWSLLGPVPATRDPDPVVEAERARARRREWGFAILIPIGFVASLGIARLARDVPGVLGLDHTISEDPRIAIYGIVAVGFASYVGRTKLALPVVIVLSIVGLVAIALVLES